MVHWYRRDKLRRWGFDIHLGCDNPTKLLHWSSVVVSNSDSKVIGKKYLQHLDRTSRIAVLLTCDRGTENTLATRIHAMLQQMRLNGTNVWIHDKSARNQRPEMLMGFLKRWCTGPFIQLFKNLEKLHLYTPLNHVDMLCLYTVFHPIIVRKLAEFKERWNSHRIRKQPGVQYSGYSPRYMYDALDPDLQSRQDTPLSPLYSLDDVAHAAGIDDWRSTTDPTPPRTAAFDAVCQQVLPRNLDELTLNNGQEFYLRLRREYGAVPGQGGS